MERSNSTHPSGVAPASSRPADGVREAVAPDVTSRHWKVPAAATAAPCGATGAKAPLSTTKEDPQPYALTMSDGSKPGTETEALPLSERIATREVPSSAKTVPRLVWASGIPETCDPVSGIVAATAAGTRAAGSAAYPPAAAVTAVAAAGPVAPMTVRAVARATRPARLVVSMRIPFSSGLPT